MEIPDKILEIAKNINKQDNRMTSHPVFQVMEKGSDGVRRVDEVFFTQDSADEYIERNAHNLCEPYVYIASGYKNPEWRTIRDFLMGLEK